MWFRQDPVHDPSEPLSQVGQSCDSDKIQFMTPSEPLSQVGRSCDSDKIQFMTLLSHYLRLEGHVIQTRSSSWPFWAIISGWTVMWFRQDPVHDSFWAIISGWTVMWFRQDPVHDHSEPLSQVGQSCDSDKIQFMTLLSHYLRLDSHVIQTRSSSWPFWAIISGWTVMWFRQDPVHDSFWAIISGWTVMWFRQDPVHDPSEPLSQVGQSWDSDKIQFMTLLSHYLRLDGHVIQTRSSSWLLLSHYLRLDGHMIQTRSSSWLLLSHYLRLDSHVIQTRSSSWLLLSHYLRLDSHVIQTRSSSWPFWAITSGWTVMMWS